jgi:hypothetical protein
MPVQHRRRRPTEDGRRGEVFDGVGESRPYSTSRSKMLASIEYGSVLAQGYDGDRRQQTLRANLAFAPSKGGKSTLASGQFAPTYKSEQAHEFGNRKRFCPNSSCSRASTDLTGLGSMVLTFDVTGIDPSSICSWMTAQPTTLQPHEIAFHSKNKIPISYRFDVL